MQANHATQSEAWLVVLKSKTPRPGVYYEEAVEEALCFGWIDGVMRGTEAGFYYLRFSPRKAGSVWSLSNIQRVERLTAQGKMSAAGLAKVQEAKENREWAAAIQREDLSRLPADLQAALETTPNAQANFEKFPASLKKQILYWIASARTEPTLQKRLRAVALMAARNQKQFPPPQQ